MTDLILFTGQSNMEGQTGILPSPNAPVPGAWEYRFLSDSLIPLCHPTGENIAFDGTPGSVTHADAFLAAWQGCGSMLPDFCRAYTEESGRYAVAVQCAKGATTMHYWQNDQPVYPLMLEKFRKAEQAVTASGQSIGRRFAVMLQGESDAIASVDREAYMESMRCLQSSLEKDLGVRLFDRDCIPLRVTPAGEHFIQEAQSLLYQEEQLLKTMERFRTGEEGRLTIGISPFRSLSFP